MFELRIILDVSAKLFLLSSMYYFVFSPLKRAQGFLLVAEIWDYFSHHSGYYMRYQERNPHLLHAKQAIYCIISPALSSLLLKNNSTRYENLTDIFFPLVYLSNIEQIEVSFQPFFILWCL